MPDRLCAKCRLPLWSHWNGEKYVKCEGATKAMEALSPANLKMVPPIDPRVELLITALEKRVAVLENKNDPASEDAGPTR